MTAGSRIKLEKSLKILERLHFKKENIMVTGSTALDMHGILPPERKVHDVDFLIKMDEQTWRCLKLIEAVGGDDSKEYYPWSDNVILNCGDLVINIWKVKEFEDTTLKDSETGILVSPIKRILEAKRKYRRAKDIQDINNICKYIL